MERLTYRGENGKPYVRADGYYHHCRINLDSIAERLDEYEDAEELGLLIRLPCKVGTPCWKVWQFGGEFGVTDWVFDYDDISQFGITVFLNREEAEAALAKEKHDET